MKNLYLVLLILITLSSCGLKEKYKNCQEASSNAVGKTYDDIVKKWGEPNKKSVDLNRLKIDCLWNNVTNDNSKVGLTFDVIDPYNTGELLPVRSKSYIGCGSVDDWF